MRRHHDFRARPWRLPLAAISGAVLWAAATALAARVAPAGSPVMAARVKAEFLHAWTNYRRWAWGHDELRPLSRTPRDWYGQSLMMTPVDALDTLVIMRLDRQADADRELIARRLDFDKDIYVKTFEVTIRLLGGLLSGYQFTGDRRLLPRPRIWARAFCRPSIRRPAFPGSTSICAPAPRAARAPIPPRPARCCWSSAL